MFGGWLGEENGRNTNDKGSEVEACFSKSEDSSVTRFGLLLRWEATEEF